MHNLFIPTKVQIVEKCKFGIIQKGAKQRIGKHPKRYRKQTFPGQAPASKMLKNETF
jgi:hypothetical protein